MQISYFFRKPSPNFHSIEKLFKSIIGHFPEQNVKLHFAKYISNGLINRLLIALDARKNQGDINHITGHIHFIAPFLSKKKTILTIHDIGIVKQGNFLKRLIIRFFWFTLPIKCVRFVTVISEFTKNELLQYFKIKQDKIVVINNCIADVYQYSPKTKINPKPVLLQIGTKVNKNLENVIKSLKGIDCKLVIIGELNSAQLAQLKQCSIDFENYCNIDENEMFVHFTKCDMLIYVSIYEGFGMPVVEANAVGRPVLASDIEPIKSVAGNAALLVDPYNIAAIRDGILKLLKDNDLFKNLISNGLINAAKYRSEITSEKYMELYKKMLANE